MFCRQGCQLNTAPWADVRRVLVYRFATLTNVHQLLFVHPVRLHRSTCSQGWQPDVLDGSAI